MVHFRRNAFTVAELLVAIAIVAIIAAIALPVLFRARNKGDLAVCVSNVRQLIMAAKMYESDYGALPVQCNPDRYWALMIDPYVKSDALFLCPSDPTHGTVYQWGPRRKSSYIYYYTCVHLGPGGSYRQPATNSPLVGCGAHNEYEQVIGRYDGSIELPPPFRYPEVQIQFDEQ
jgi:prepilin-type N-terminal cleavage/methylation domain-containing protein